jgi:hypothetical protein
VRIVRNSSQSLMLRDQSIWITVLCFASAAFLLIYQIVRQVQSNLWLTAGIFVLFGLAFFRQSTVEFDKTAQLCSVSTRSVFKRSRHRIRFADIRDVRVDAEPLSASLQRENYRLGLVTSSGVIALSDTYEPNLLHHTELRRTIFEALGRQEEGTAEPDPIKSLVEQGRVVEAVALLRQRDNLDLETARQRIADLQNRAKQD